MTHDAIVIGGGPAGATAAILLAQAGWRVAVVEKSRFPRRKVCGEFVSASNLPLLQELGVAQAFASLAGPEVRRAGIFARDEQLAAPMPRLKGDIGWGRALGRERLDLLLLDRAAELGAEIRQPWKAIGLAREGKSFACRIGKGSAEELLHAPIVIAAHGSWERVNLPSQPARKHSPSDLLAFKAHFRNSALEPDLMPLIAFPGGYGGMVHADDGRVSLSCCVRRDALQQWRRRYRTRSAADAVAKHIAASCAGVREALAGARLDSGWLSAGPINPGIRTGYADGIFLVGNAAGEAHPIVAEGISMAMQSAAMLSHHLIACQDDVVTGVRYEEIGRAYSAEWRKSFSTRIRAAAFFAHLAMRPGAASALLPLLGRYPEMITWGARLSGKTRLTRSPPAEAAAPSP